jgi:hypothetical protein
MKARLSARLAKLETIASADMDRQREEFVAAYIQVARELFGEDGYRRMAARLQELEALHASTPPGVG